MHHQKNNISLYLFFFFPALNVRDIFPQFRTMQHVRYASLKSGVTSCKLALRSSYFSMLSKTIADTLCMKQGIHMSHWNLSYVS